MVEREVVHEFWRAHMHHPFGRLVDKKKRRLVRIIINMRMDDDEVGGIVRSDEPLLAVDVPFALDLAGGCFDAARVRTCIFLGDREGAAPIALNGR